MDHERSHGEAVAPKPAQGIHHGVVPRGTNLCAELLLDRGDGLLRRAGCAVSLLGSRDEPDAAVGLVAAAGDEAALLQPVDELAQRLLGHAGDRGQVGDADPGWRNHLENAPVAAPQLGELVADSCAELGVQPPGDCLQPAGQVIRQGIQGGRLAFCHKATLLYFDRQATLPFWSAPPTCSGGIMATRPDTDEDLMNFAWLTSAELSTVTSAAAGRPVQNPV